MYVLIIYEAVFKVVSFENNFPHPEINLKKKILF